jgi:hypothetical protein
MLAVKSTRCYRPAMGQPTKRTLRERRRQQRLAENSAPPLPNLTPQGLSIAGPKDGRHWRSLRRRAALIDPSLEGDSNRIRENRLEILAAMRDSGIQRLRNRADRYHSRRSWGLCPISGCRDLIVEGLKFCAKHSAEVRSQYWSKRTTGVCTWRGCHKLALPGYLHCFGHQVRVAQTNSLRRLARALGPPRAPQPPS